MVWSGTAAATISALGSLGGGMMSSASSKKQYKYARQLMLENQAFQREVAQNAHQWEMQDLQAAGLNPALTTGASSAGAIASGSSPQSTSTGNTFDFSGLISDINQTRQTNANVEKTDKETEVIPQQINNETTNAKANLISAEAAKKNAETQEKLASGGIFTRNIGTFLTDVPEKVKNALSKETRKDAKNFIMKLKNSAK